MTKGHGTSDSRPGPNQTNRVPKRPLSPKPPVPPYRPVVGRVPAQPPLPHPVERPGMTDREWSVEAGYGQPSVEIPSDAAAFDDSLPYAPQPRPRRRQRRKPSIRLPQLRFPTSLQFWMIFAIVLFTGVGGLSAALLLKLPALPNCPSIFWPTASGSLRLYCAQLAANKKTTNDLLEAIALVNELPADHPLRPQIDQLIEQWSTDILNLANEAFDRGELQGAIDIANKIPENTSAHTLVEERIENWRTIWAKAEKIYSDAEKAIQDQDLRGAFSIAVRLLDVGNTYWETTKYQELNNRIEVARVEGAKLSKISTLIRRGGLSNLLSAVKLLEEFKPESPAYSEAQRLMVKIGKEMMELAEDQLDREDAQDAIAIIRQIPERAGLQEEGQDFISLALAQEQSWGETVADLETAIIQAQRIESDRPLYSKAQQLISRWQLEIQDLAHLEMARQYAESGDLTAAIAEAERVPPNNPRGDEAQREVDQWTAQIQTTEDRPILDEADRLAVGGDVVSLQAAINRASQIRRGRALYSDARSRIEEWTARVQRTQDQPYLDRARQQAAAGDLGGAIATAQQIQPGRALYDDAQSDLRQWRNQVEGQNRLGRAYNSAGGGTAATLLEAIRTAEQVPENSSARSEADRMINVWSQQILRIAEEESGYSLERAIATAQLVPPRTDAYAGAQLQIQAWRQQLGAGN